MAAYMGFHDSVFSQFAFYATATTFKMMALSFWTTKYRFKEGVFANEEDCASYNGTSELTTSNPVIERIRRCHLNDLENIVPFVLLGSMYCMTEPDERWALLHFRLFFASRLLHTFCYLSPVRQPSRALMFVSGTAVNISMGVAVLRAGRY